MNDARKDIELSLTAFSGRIGLVVIGPEGSIEVDGIPEVGATLIVTCVQDTVMGSIHRFGFPLRRTPQQKFRITTTIVKVAGDDEDWLAFGELVSVEGMQPRHPAWATIKPGESMAMIYLSFDEPDELKSSDSGADESTTAPDSNNPMN